MNLKIREIFYSLQGEGGRKGEASIFIRLSNCNLNCHFCDTDWSYGNEIPLSVIYDEISKYKAKWIVWTGGEPTLQLTKQVVDYFKAYGYKQAIETNGTNPVPAGLDYVTCSPKKESTRLHEVFPNGVDEFRFVFDRINRPNHDVSLLPPAKHYFVSPIFVGERKKKMDMDEDNVHAAIQFVLDNPQWKLSLQTHKILDIR